MTSTSEKKKGPFASAPVASVARHFWSAMAGRRNPRQLLPILVLAGSTGLPTEPQVEEMAGAGQLRPVARIVSSAASAASSSWTSRSAPRVCLVELVRPIARHRAQVRPTGLRGAGPWARRGDKGEVTSGHA